MASLLLASAALSPLYAPPGDGEDFLSGVKLGKRANLSAKVRRKAAARDAQRKRTAVVQGAAASANPVDAGPAAARAIAPVAPEQLSPSALRAKQALDAGNALRIELYSSRDKEKLRGMDKDGVDSGRYLFINDWQEAGATIKEVVLNGSFQVRPSSLESQLFNMEEQGLRAVSPQPNVVWTLEKSSHPHFPFVEHFATQRLMNSKFFGRYRYLSHLVLQDLESLVQMWNYRGEYSEDALAGPHVTSRDMAGHIKANRDNEPLKRVVPELAKASNSTLMKSNRMYGSTPWMIYGAISRPVDEDCSKWYHDVVICDVAANISQDDTKLLTERVLNFASKVRGLQRVSCRDRYLWTPGQNSGDISVKVLEACGFTLQEYPAGLSQTEWGYMCPIGDGAAAQSSPNSGVVYAGAVLDKANAVAAEPDAAAGVGYPAPAAGAGAGAAAAAPSPSASGPAVREDTKRTPMGTAGRISAPAMSEAGAGTHPAPTARAASTMDAKKN